MRPWRFGYGWSGPRMIYHVYREDGSLVVHRLVNRNDILGAVIRYRWWLVALGALAGWAADALMAT